MKGRFEVNKIIAALIPLTTLIALMLLGIATFMICAPDILLVFFLSFAGLCLLILLLIALFFIIRCGIDKRREKKDITE